MEQSQYKVVEGSRKSVFSLILGILGLFGWFLPVLGFPITIVGLILGIKGMKTFKRKMAIVGIILCSVGLSFSIANAAIGAYMAATGQHPLVNKILNQEKSMISTTTTSGGLNR